MKTRLPGHLAIMGLAALLWATQAYAQVLPEPHWLKEGVPDFSQYAREQWGLNWCAPTAAMNSIWYYSQHGYPGILAPGREWGDPEDASDSIEEMAGYMGTLPGGGGTAPGNIRDGWQNYCNHYYPQSGWPHFHTRLLTRNDFASSADMWEYMCWELYRCQDVVPLVYWNATEGHAITMAGWNGNSIRINDPANNPGDAHGWGWENLEVPLTFDPTGLGISWATGTGVITSFVVTCPEIPEPCTLVLLGAGLAGLVVLGNRRIRKG